MAKNTNKKNANYNFRDQVEPDQRMGAGDFANMPPGPKLMKFSKQHSYRDGIINSFTSSVTETSDIYENRRSKESQNDHA